MKWFGWKFAVGLAAALAGILAGSDAVQAAGDQEMERRIDILSREIEDLKRTQKDAGKPGALARTHVGGYMELHYLSTQDGDGENFDFHRFVMYTGHRFNDWIRFHSELEVERAFVQDRNGEIYLEQAYIDFTPRENFGVRGGVVLVPFGLVNLFHEPPTFHGVERPDVDNKIIPTTWFAAGGGIHGSLTFGLKYQIYGVNSLQFINGGRDGTTASVQLGTDGLRSLRQKQFGSETNGNVLDLAIVGRLDYAVERHPLNIGFSYYGGDAGDKVADSGGKPKISGYAFDARYKQDRIDFVGEWARFDVDGADKLRTLTGTDQAKQLEGWYAQGGYWFLQPGDREGLLSDGGLAAFVRFEKYDTAKKMPSNSTNTAQNDRDREQWVYGITFKPVQNLAVKVDYTSFRDADGTTVDNDKFNAGIGWQF